MLTLAAYVGYVRRPFSLASLPGGRGVLFALGLMAKPMLVTLPFVLLLLDYWPLGRWTHGPLSLWESVTHGPLSLRERVRVRGSGEELTVSMCRPVTGSPHPRAHEVVVSRRERGLALTLALSPTAVRCPERGPVSTAFRSACCSWRNCRWRRWRRFPAC